MIKNILFLCDANVWRSQMAEWFFRFKLTDINVSSAAIKEDVRKKYNNKPASKIITHMKMKNIDISSHKIQLFSKKLWDNADICLYSLA